MTNETLLKYLEKAATVTIEEMSFLPFESITIVEKAEDGSEDQLWSTIEILEPYTGKMLLAFTNDIAKELAMSIYGFEDENELTDELMLDTISELLNTISGRFLSNLIPPDQAFKLGLPLKGTGPKESLQDEALRLKCTIEESEIIVAVGGEDFCAYNESNV